MPNYAQAKSIYVVPGKVKSCSLLLLLFNIRFDYFLKKCPELVDASLCPINTLLSFMCVIYSASDPDKTQLPIWSLSWRFESVVPSRQRVTRKARSTMLSLGDT